MIRNIFVSLIGYIVPLLVAIPIIPYLMKRIGDHNFGLLALVWTIIFFARACDFGISTSITKYVAQYRNNPALRKTGLVLIISMASVLQILALAIYFIHFTISSAPLETSNIIMLSSFAILPMAIINFSRAVLEAERRFQTLSLLRVIYMPTNFLVPAAIIIWQQNAPIYFLVYGILFSKMIEAANYGLYGINKATLKAKYSQNKQYAYIKFGKWIGVNSILGPIFNYSDRFITSSVISVSSLSLLVPASELINRLIVLPMAVTSVLFPEFSSNKNKLLNTQKRSINAYLFINTLIAASLMICSDTLISIWLGDTYSTTAEILILFLVAWPLASQNRLVSTYLQTRNMQHAVTISASIIAVIYLTLTYMLIIKIGLIGAPIASIIRVIFVYVRYDQLTAQVNESTSKINAVFSIITLLSLGYSIIVLNRYETSFLILALYIASSIQSIKYIYTTVTAIYLKNRHKVNET